MQQKRLKCTHLTAIVKAFITARLAPHPIKHVNKQYDAFKESLTQ
jgi:hypothetical protein